MKKSLLNKLNAEEIIERVSNLQPNDNRRWGKMNATEMLYHCNLANNFIFNDKSPWQKPSLKHRIIKFICFTFITRIPKNNRQPSRINSKGKIDEDKFAEQKNLYIETIRRFPLQDKAFTSIHPRLGYLTNKEWGLITWMHMDHHLRQFGV